MSELFIPLCQHHDGGPWWVPVTARPGTREEAERFARERTEDFAAAHRSPGTTAIFRLTQETS